jgi:hypothetical protein
MIHARGDGFWKVVGRHPFGVLLGALFLMIGLSPSVSLITKFHPEFRGMAVLAPLSMVMIGASMFALWKRARHHATHMLAGGLIIVLLTLGGLVSHHGLALAQIIAQIIFLSYMIGVVVRSVFRAADITGDILCGAVCIYLLFGVLSGFVFVLIEYLLPGSFLISNWQANPAEQQSSFLHDPGWLIYFSFVTLTTVGYGDVLPGNAIARSAAVLVAIVGQILLVVQIARLVGLHVAQGTIVKKHDD